MEEPRPLSRETLEILQHQDWPDLLARAAFYLRSLGRPLPPGVTEQELLNDAITDLFLGVRHWDPKQYPNVFIIICGILRSQTSRHGSHYAAKREALRSSVDISQLVENAALSLKPDLDGLDDEVAWNALNEVLSNDHELQDFVAATRLGCESPEDYEREFNISKARVYELRRKLLPFIPRAAKRLSNHQPPSTHA